MPALGFHSLFDYKKITAYYSVVKDPERPQQGRMISTVNTITSCLKAQGLSCKPYADACTTHSAKTAWHP